MTSPRRRQTTWEPTTDIYLVWLNGCHVNSIKHRILRNIKLIRHKDMSWEHGPDCEEQNVGFFATVLTTKSWTRRITKLDMIGSTQETSVIHQIHVRAQVAMVEHTQVKQHVIWREERLQKKWSSGDPTGTDNYNWSRSRMLLKNYMFKACLKQRRTWHTRILWLWRRLTR